MKRFLIGFTLVEMIIATAVFSLIVVSTGSLLFLVQRISLQQRQNLELNENIRWAQTYLRKEVDQCSNITILSASGLDGFNCTMNNGNIIWYWRGNATYGNNTTVYRSLGTTLANANTSKQELLTNLVNNTGNAAVFNLSSGNSLLYVNMTLCPFTDRALGTGNQAFRSRLAIRKRN